MPETLKTLVNRAAIVSKHVDIVNEKSFEVERFSGKLKKGKEVSSILQKVILVRLTNMKIDINFIKKTHPAN